MCNAMKWVAALLLLLIPVPMGADPPYTLTGYLSARGLRARGQSSWLEGGFGRLGAGGSRPGDHATFLLGVAQIGFDWTPSRFFDLHIAGIGRGEPSSYGGRRAGIPEAYADLKAASGANELQLRAGQFFLPTSRENKGDLWTSLYTIDFSPLNSWIGEEFRPIGADLQWKHTTSRGAIVTAAGTAFRGNDSTGALLAWRGWSTGNRLSVYNEVLPLPPLFSLRDSRFFAQQRRDGATAFGTDLDGRTGFSARARVQLPERFSLLYTHVDNRGDRGLHRGEYAWATRFDVAGLEVGNPDTMILVAEAARGVTGMGMRSGAHVDMRFSTSYLLVSRRSGRLRFSARYAWFETDDLDGTAAETNSERGRAWTLSSFYDLTPHLRGGLEYTNISGPRIAAGESGFDRNTDGQSTTLELRYKWGR